MDLAPLTTARRGAELAHRGRRRGHRGLRPARRPGRAQPEVRRVRACTLTDNLPSRRVLEKAGFAYTGIEDGEAVYERDAPPA